MSSAKKPESFLTRPIAGVKAWIWLTALVCVAAVAVGVIATRGSTAGEVITGVQKVRITVKDYGEITCELYPDVAPITVRNFLSLVDRGFYDGLTFHRIISGFMIQGGDPRGNGTGGSGTNIKGEFSANGVNNTLAHTRGVLSMARSQDYDSASSQFFIMHGDAPWLDGSYAAFGKVLEGMEVVDAICKNTPVTDGNGSVAKEKQPVILKIERVK